MGVSGVRHATWASTSTAGTCGMASREAWAVGEGWATNVTYFLKDSRAITTPGPYAARGVSMVVVMGRL